MIVNENFLDNFAELKAFNGEFKEYKNIDGAEYPAICLDIPRGVKSELYKTIEKNIGITIIPRYTFLRRNEEGNSEPYQAHSDLNMGEMTCIVYIRGDGGTAFLRHKETGMFMNNPALYDVWAKDANNYNAWEVTDFIDLEPNRSLMYHGSLIHRGEPVEGSGKGDNARELLICFFDKSILQRSFDAQAIKSILTHPDIAEDVGVKEGVDFDVPVDDPDHHFLMAEGCLFILHKEGDDWQIHANVLKNTRDIAYQAGQEALSYAFNQLAADRVIARIPQKYSNVYHFALKSGMQDSGFEEGKHFLTLEQTQWDG